MVDSYSNAACTGPTKLHVLALLPDCVVSDGMAEKHGFRAKRGFVLKQRRGQHVHFSLGCVNTEAEAVSADVTGEAHGSAAQCTWYQAEAAPRGLTRQSSKDQ